MKKIKTLLIIFSVLSGLLIGSGFYINSLDNKVFISVPSCEDCLPDNLDCAMNNLSYAKQIMCETFQKSCQECEERRKPLLEIAQAEHTKYENNINYLFFAIVTSIGLTLSTAIAYLAVKFSFVRTMGAVSLVWFVITIVLIGAETAVLAQRMVGILVFNLPIFLFWLYRFIRLGPSKMFKDH